MKTSRLAEELSAELRRERVPLGIVAVASLLAKGGALLPGLSIDDYMNAAGPFMGPTLSQGRHGQWLFLKITEALGAEMIGARILFVSFAIIAYALFGLAVVRFWRVRGSGWMPIAAAIMIANHPYTVEIFTFRNALATAAIVMVLLALVLFLAARGERWLLIGSLAFAVALSFYQIALHFALMIAIVGLAIELARILVDAGQPRDAAGEPGRAAWTQLLESRSSRLLAIVTCGVVIYIALSFSTNRALAVADEYFGILPLAEIPGRLRTSALDVLDTFLETNRLIPQATRLAFGAIVGVALVGLLWRGVRRRPRTRGALAWLAIVTLLGLALLWSVGLSLVLRTYWPVPRNMAHVGILWGGSLVLAALAAHPLFLRRCLAVMSASIVFSFIGSNEHALNDQLRINALDRQMANRIVARLELQEGFPLVRRLIVLGLGWTPYPTGPMRTFWGDMNISAFGATWSQATLFREVTGHDLVAEYSPAEQASAEAYCGSVLPWPSRESVKVEGDLAIICLKP